jgi:hypothetical protein
MRARLVLASSLVLTATAVPAVSAQNLVSNPGFETFDFTGWTQGGNTINDGVSAFPLYVHSGTYGAFFGAVGTRSSIAQSLATTAGEFYTLSFWLRSDGGTTNTFGAFWDGIEVTWLANAGAFGYTQYSFNLQAIDASTVLEFSFRQDPAFWGLDDVSVTAESTVPEPATMTLLATGLAGLAASRKRRRNPA